MYENIPLLSYGTVQNAANKYQQLVFMKNWWKISQNYQVLKPFFFFFFFLIWVLRPFQEYFTYIEPIVHRRWAKTGEPGEKPPDHL